MSDFSSRFGANFVFYVRLWDQQCQCIIQGPYKPHAVRLQMAVLTQACGGCKRRKELTIGNFKPTFGRTGVEFGATCRTCLQKRADASAKKREEKRAQDENQSPQDSGSHPRAPRKQQSDQDDTSDFVGLVPKTLDVFLQSIMCSSDKPVYAAITIGALAVVDAKDRTDSLAKQISEAVGYQFTFVILCLRHHLKV
ncbi:hypothetical protein CPB85DRAFT_1445441 [Mucidula mucida]|nr:hypothetical protein CPB85DRAFT_1445441 [Mucidula mucida]